MRRALISVSDKTGVIEFARGLAARGFEIVSTGGTARALQAASIAVTPVAAVTGVPEMLDGRVKTLHPAIHGGILARRARAGDLEALDRLGIVPIDVVAVNLYPFVETAADPSISVDELIEQIDIGGPSLVRAAAKNFLDVLIVVSPDDYPDVLDRLDGAGPADLAFRLALARKAFAHTAAYDAAIAATLSTISAGEAGLARGADAAGSLPAALFLPLQKIRDLRYGENPHQRGAWYRVEGQSGVPQILQGKELSFTNLLDVDAAMRLVSEFQEPAAAVIKHTNPCGVATASSIDAAYRTARDADALSAFGGIVGLNRPIDRATAEELTRTFIEAVVAPGVDADALPMLAVKKNLRVVVADLQSRGLAPHRGAPVDVRSLLAGVLVQDRDQVSEAGPVWPSAEVCGGDVPPLRVVTRRQPTPDEWRALRFAWTVAAHVKSNAVIFTTADRTLAIGAGQMSRVDAVKVAVMKAADRSRGGGEAAARPLAGSVAASDAFFPFRDGLDAVAAAGATAVVQPGGSVRDAEVIAAADEHGLAMVFTGRRHFRH